MAHLTTGQIRQLIEIDAANGSTGIRHELQALIRRLTLGGVAVNENDPRQVQAKRLYEFGFGGESSFAKYLNSVPAIPVFGDDNIVRMFPRLVLVDGRLSITEQCELLGIDFNIDDEFDDFREGQSPDPRAVYWIRARQLPHVNKRGLTVPSVCSWDGLHARGAITTFTIREGMALFAQDSEDYTRSMYFAESSHHTLENMCAVLLAGKRPFLTYNDGNFTGV